jgi:hypothetical protein
MQAGTGCICGTALPPSDQSLIASFGEIRARCPALRKILVPNSIWQEFQGWCDRLDGMAIQQSELLMAHQRGSLGRVTSPIHRYLLQSEMVRTDARKQYTKDLQETWLGDLELLERHRKWRMFHGRVAELQFAEWLEEHSYTITGLEALREGPDVEAVSRNGLNCTFEVKFIGSENADLEMLVKSIKGEPSGDFVSPYAAINYLTFRVYEAARQFQTASTNRTVVLIIDKAAWGDLSSSSRKIGSIGGTQSLLPRTGGGITSSLANTRSIRAYLTILPRLFAPPIRSGFFGNRQSSSFAASTISELTKVSCEQSVAGGASQGEPPKLAFFRFGLERARARRIMF